MPHVVRRPGVIAGVSVAAFLALVHAINDVLTAVLGALLPTLQVRFAASATTLALLVAVYSISSSVTQPFLGGLAERLGVRTTLGVSVILTASSLALVGLAPSVGVLVLLLVVGGLGSAALHPVATSVVGGPRARRPGLSVGLFTAGGMAGFAAGPVLVLLLAARFGVGSIAWLMVPGVALGLLALRLLPDWEPHARVRHARLRVGSVLRGPLAWLVVAATLVSVAFLTFTSAVPLWLVGQHGRSPDDPLLGWTLGVFSLAAGLGAILGGAVAPRVGQRVTIALSLGAAAVPLSAVLLLPPATWAFFAAIALAGMLLYASQPLLALAAQVAVPEAPAAASGMVLGFSHGLAGGLYLVVGWLQEHVGLEVAMAASFLLLIPAAVIAWHGVGRLSRSAGREALHGEAPVPAGRHRRLTAVGATDRAE